MITLKSHSRGRKPETTVIGETEGLRDRQSWQLVHLRQGDLITCAMCQRITGPNRPWMDKLGHWQDHPMRCR